MIDETRWEKRESRKFYIQGTGEYGTVTVVKNRKKGFFTTISESVGVEEYGERFASEEEAKKAVEKEIGENALAKTATYFMDKEWAPLG